MKNKKLMKIIIITIMFMFFAYSISSNVIATTQSIFNDPNLKNINQGLSGANTSTGILGAINTVIGLLQVAGTGISLIMISALGIKYILASVEEKAEIKKTAMPIIIGAILLFGAVNIIALVEKFSSSVINS